MLNMKFTIEGFSQEYAATLKKKIEVKQRGVVKEKEIKIDCTDLVILRWFVDFFPDMKKMIIDGKEYAWLTHKKMLNDLPLLDISKRACIERMHKLVEFGILDYKLVKDGGTFSLYGFGVNYMNLVRSNEGGIRSTDIGGIRSTDTGVYVQPDNKDKSIIDTSINNINKESIEEKNDSDEKSSPPPPSEKNKKDSVDYQGVIDVYNETCVSLPSVQKLTDKRKRALKSITKKFSVEDLKTVFKKAEESSFLNGSSDKWSGATFDWLIKEDNIVKVLEGNYDDKVSRRKASYDLDAYEKDNLKEIINDFNELNDKGSKRKGLFTIEASEVE